MRIGSGVSGASVPGTLFLGRTESTEREEDEKVVDDLDDTRDEEGGRRAAATLKAHPVTVGDSAVATLRALRETGRRGPLSGSTTAIE